jgi:2-keto-4-pentenoate hydratase/2-oxohepta-3-ene-1,7-dioic acid hydratase in catechol pathway
LSPGRVLKPGDRVEVTISKIGTLANTVEREA